MQVTQHRRFQMTPHRATNPRDCLAVAAPFAMKQRMWLGAGTLLGMHRDGGFIPHDTDIDFMRVMDWNEPNDVALPSEEFEPIRTVTHQGRTMQRAYMRDKVIVDFAFFYRGLGSDPDEAIHVHDCGVIRMKVDLAEPVSRGEFEGSEVLLPAKVEPWLEWWYGTTWRVPRTEKTRADLDSVCLERG